MIQNAISVSELSDFPKYKIGCVIAQKNKVLSASFNSTKTHPLQKKMNKERFEVDNTPHSLHAEIHALSYLIDCDIDWKGSVLYTARKRKDGHYGMARPCPSCMKLIKKLGIKNIVYTTDYGIAQEEIEE